MFWAGEDPDRTLETLLGLGVRHGQIGIPGDLPLRGEVVRWRVAAERAGFTIYTVFAAYEGESYADVATVRETVGLVPAATRVVRQARTLEVLEFAAEIGASAIATHIGCIPADPSHPDYRAVADSVRQTCDEAAKRGLKFALETGQEPAAELLRFMGDVSRPNLGINFDPANMILYGTGEPVPALKLLQERVLSVHCKDGTWPESADALGTEMPLSKGKVDWPAFLKQLDQAGYAAPLAIEREAPDAAQRLQDISSGLAFLQSQLCVL